MNRRVIAALALLAFTVACGSPLQNAARTLFEQISLDDPAAPATFEENKELFLSPEAVPLWVEALESNDSAKVRVWAAEILGRIGDESSLPTLAASMSDSRDVRDAAVNAIRQFPEDQAGRAFVQAIEEGNREAQGAGLAQISRLEAVDAVPAVALIAASGDVMISRTAIDTLGDIGDGAAAEALAALVTKTDLDSGCRRQAMLNLNRIEGTEELVATVRAALEAAGDETSTALLEQQ